MTAGSQTGGSLQSQVLTTDTVAREQRIEYWRDAICDVFVDLDCEEVDPDGDGFYGRIVSRSLGNLQFSDVISSGQRVVRSASRIRRAREDYFLVSLQMQGTGMVIQDGRAARLAEGDFALYDTARPYELVFDSPFSQMVARLPRSAVASRIVAPGWVTARRIDGRSGVGRVALGYLAELDRQMPGLEHHVGSRLCDMFLDLITLAISEPVGAQSRVSNGRLAQLHRIQSFIEDHLSDPELGPQTVAAAHHITPRYLNMLFKASDISVSRWIWQKRLEKCERDLADPRHAGRTIGEIAYARGFNDLTHFSRTFKVRYGLSPRDYRQARLV